MGLKTHSLRPGLLVYCTARVTGGVSYSHEDIDQEREGDSETKTIKTVKHTENVKERKKAEVLRTNIRSMITKACWPSMFGLFCPTEDKNGKGPKVLREAVRDAQREVRKFNGKATTCRVLLTVIPAKVETSDAAAMAGISAEIKTKLEEAKKLLSLGKPEAARKLATSMKDLGRMLDDDLAEVTDTAVKSLRKAASAIVKEGADTANKAAEILGKMDLKPIDSARVAFLDLETSCGEEIEAGAPAADIQRVAGIDLEDVPPPKRNKANKSRRVSIWD